MTGRDILNILNPNWRFFESIQHQKSASQPMRSSWTTLLIPCDPNLETLFFPSRIYLNQLQNILPSGSTIDPIKNGLSSFLTSRHLLVKNWPSSNFTHTKTTKTMPFQSPFNLSTFLGLNAISNRKYTTKPLGPSPANTFPSSIFAGSIYEPEIFHSAPTLDHPIEDLDLEPQFIDLISISDHLIKKNYQTVIKLCKASLKPHQDSISTASTTDSPSRPLRREIAQVYSFLSDAYCHLKQLDNALDAMKSALDIFPTLEYCTDLADQYLQMDQYLNALELANQAIEMSTSVDVDPFVIKAWALFKLERYDSEIIQLCDLAISRDPFVIPAFILKAEMLAHSGKFNQAIKTLNRALSRGGHLWEVVQLKIKYLRQLNLLEDALNAVELCLNEEESSNQSEVHLEATKLALQLENWQVALQHLPAVNEAFKMGYIEHVHVLLKMNKIEKVEALIQMAEASGEMESRLLERDHQNPLKINIETIKIQLERIKSRP